MEVIVYILSVCSKSDSAADNRQRVPFRSHRRIRSVRPRFILLQLSEHDSSFNFSYKYKSEMDPIECAKVFLYFFSSLPFLNLVLSFGHLQVNGSQYCWISALVTGKHTTDATGAYLFPIIQHYDKD